MSVTIDRLSIEIESDAQGAYQGIDNLATSLGKLKQNGSFGTAVKNLKGLREALDGLTIDSSLMNNIRRLSNQAAQISNSLNGVATATRNASGGFRNVSGRINATTLNMSSFVTVAQAVVDTVRNISRAMGSIINDASEWDGIVQRFSRGFGSAAQSTYEWIQRLNKEMGINIQQFMQYSSIYATMLTGFGVTNDDAAKMALGYTELTYDIWAGYNDIYKTYAEAADAVKSAIAGEVEPIRRAGFTIIESTLEQTAANYGLEVSLENATEAQKSYLRYLTLVDQAYAQSLVGTYASEMTTAEGLMRTLSQQVKSLSQAFGSLFLPALVKIVPWLQAFVELIKDAIVAIGAFFGISIQFADFSNSVSTGASATDQFADSANSAAKAAKELKKATIGIDELNIISPPTASGGAGAGGAGFAGLDVNSLWDEKIFEKVQTQVDELKSKIKDLLPVAAGIALIIKLAGGAAVKKLKEILLSGILAGSMNLHIAADMLKSLGTTLLNTITNSTIFTKLISPIATKVMGALTKVGAFLASLPGWGIAIIAAIVGTIILGFVDYDFTSVGEKFGSVMATVIGKPAIWIGNIAKTIWNGISSAFNWLKENFTMENIVSFIDKVFSVEFWTNTVWPKMVEIGGNIVEGLWSGITGWFANLMGNLKEFWDGFVKGWNDRLEISSPSKLFERMGAFLIEGLWLGITGWFKKLIANVSKFVDDTIKKVKEFFGISKNESITFKTIGENLISSMWNGITGWFETLKKNLSKFVDDTIKEVKSFFGIEKGTSSKFKTIGENLVQGVIDGIKGMGSSLWNSLSEWASGVISSIKGFFDIHSPSRLTKDEIGFNLVAGIVEGIADEETALVKPFANMWATTENWWSKNANLSTPSIPDINGRGTFMWASEYSSANARGSSANTMSVEEMQEAVYEGVLAAMMAGQNGSSGNEFYVYLDGRQITANVEKRQRERGVSIMGSEIKGFA